MSRNPVIFLLAVTIGLSACDLTRYVPDGKQLVMDHQVILPEQSKEDKKEQAQKDQAEADSLGVCAKDRKAAALDAGDLEELCRPKLNQKILGIRLKLRIHNSVDTVKMNRRQAKVDAKVDAKNARRAAKDTKHNRKKAKKLKEYLEKPSSRTIINDFKYKDSVCDHLPSDTIRTKFQMHVYKYQTKAYRKYVKRVKQEKKIELLSAKLDLQAGNESDAHKLSRMYNRLEKTKDQVMKACRETKHQKVMKSTFELKDREPKEYKVTTKKKRWEEWGEFPALLDTTLLANSKDNILGFLRNRGYYNARVTDSIFYGKDKPATDYSLEQIRAILRGDADSLQLTQAEVDTLAKRCYIQYYVDPGECKFIKEIRLDSLSKVPNTEMVASMRNDEQEASILSRSVLYQGQPFDANKLDEERGRLAKELDELFGYYGLTGKHFYYLTDTTVGRNWVSLTLLVDSLEFSKELEDGKKVVHKIPHTPHKVNEVFFHLNDSLSVYRYLKKLREETPYKRMKDVVEQDGMRNTLGYYPLDTIKRYNPADSVLLYTTLYSGRPWVNHYLLNRQNFLVPSHYDLGRYREDNYKRKYLERSYSQLIALGTWSQVTPELPFTVRKVSKEQMRYHVYFSQMMDTLNSPRFKGLNTMEQIDGLTAIDAFSWLGRDTISSFFGSFSRTYDHDLRLTYFANEFRWEDTLCAPCEFRYQNGRAPKSTSQEAMKSFVWRMNLNDTIYARGWEGLPYDELFKRLKVHPTFRNMPDDLFRQGIKRYSLNEWKEFYAQKGLEWQDTLCTDCSIISYDSVDVHYYLTPAKRRTLSISPEFTNDNGFYGVRLALTYTDKNLARGAERFTVDFIASLETNNSLTSQSSGFLNTFEIGPNFKFTIPSLFPLGKYNDRLSKRMYPVTEINFGGSYQQREELNRWKTTAGFTWKFRDGKTNAFEWTLLTGDYVNIQITDPEFQNTLDTTQDLSLKARYSSNFRLGALVGALKYTYDNARVTKSGNRMLWETKLNCSGLALWLAYRAFGQGFDQNDPDFFLGVPYTQFYALETDFRYYLKLSKNNMLVFRGASGAGVPYLNSKALPYQVGFSTGGSNTNRGFQSLSMGPGTYLNTTNIVTQQGDVKMEFNIEDRFPIYGYLKGALFLDASNIWTWAPDPSRPGSELSPEFLSQFGLSAGFGLRFDVDFLVVRLDLGLPVYVPSLAPSERWIFSPKPIYDALVLDIQGSSDGRVDPYNGRPHMIKFNFGIGYPF